MTFISTHETLENGFSYRTDLKDMIRYINTFSNTIFSQVAALKAILGEIDFNGRLPVSIPETEFKVGDGIGLFGKNK